MPSIALIANPGSGSCDPAEVERRLRDGGAEVERFELERAEQAASAGADRVAVAGGDGSVAPGAAAAAAAGVPLAVIAAGTANDFARRFGLPQAMAEACRLAVGGQRTRLLELGRMDGRPFVNVASLGLPAPAARRASSWKSALGPLAYAAGAAVAGATAKPVRCRALCDGSAVHDGPAWQVTVACSGAFGAGSQIEEADPSDRLLDLIAVAAGPRFKLVRLAYGLRRGGLARQPGVRHARGERIEVIASPGAAYNVDGEVVRAGSASFSVDERRFQLVVG